MNFKRCCLTTVPCELLQILDLTTLDRAATLRVLANHVWNGDNAIPRKLCVKHLRKFAGLLLSSNVVNRTVEKYQLRRLVSADAGPRYLISTGILRIGGFALMSNHTAKCLQQSLLPSRLDRHTARPKTRRLWSEHSVSSKQSSEKQP